MQIDYFLNKKVIDQIDTNIITTILFKNLKPKVNFDVDLAIKDDIFTTNYMMAYEIKSSDVGIYDEIHTFNMIALLYIEKEAQGYSFQELHEVFNSIDVGAKPKTKLEKIIHNLIEIDRLINQTEFQINENNYELVVHLLFRNTNLNLDRKINYLRNKKNDIGLNFDINFNDIEEEIRQIFIFSNQKINESLDGLTKIIIILFSFIIVQPYQKYNMMISFFVTSWYAKQHKTSIFQSLDLMFIFSKWKEILSEINQVADKNMSYDDFLKLTKSLIRQSFKKNYLNKLLSQWIIENELSNNVELIEKMILLAFISNSSAVVSISDLIDYFVINEIQIISKDEILISAKKLIESKLIKETSDGEGYISLVDELNKFKDILE